MALVLILFSWYSRPSEEQLKAQRERDSIAAVQRAEAEKAAEAPLTPFEASTEGDSLNIAVVYESTTAIWHNGAYVADDWNWSQDVIPVTLEGGTGA